MAFCVVLFCWPLYNISFFVFDIRLLTLDIKSLKPYLIFLFVLVIVLIAIKHRRISFDHLVIATLF